MDSKKPENSQYKLYLDTLGSRKFIDLIDNYTLTNEFYNELFATHCLLIGLQSSGISDGSISIDYVISSSEDYKPDVPGPRLRYGFYTTQNQLVENTIYCTNSSLNLNNKEFPQFKSARQLRRFLDQYWKNMKHMDGCKLEDFKDYSFSIKVNRNPHKINHIDYLYENVIEKMPSIKAFLDWHFLQSNIDNKIDDKPLTTRLKI